LKDEPDLEDVTDTENKLYEVAVNNLQINGKDANEKFSKAYTDAIITFSQKGDKSSKTTYTIEEIK
jgi:aspartyl/asparaginyl beta-hydroxylase (cupin superfamily)